MTSTGRRGWPLAVLVAAVGSLIASVVWVSGTGSGGGTAGTMGPYGMNGPGTAVAGDGPVDDMAAAARVADGFAGQWGLEAGEVMEFDNGYYVELVELSGSLATEVLVDRLTGAVQPEFGPAMMWNTAYGMHHSSDAGPTLLPEQARDLADQWLADNRPGEHAASPEEFPGYYTVHSMVGGDVTGMLSVHATSGDVWYHSWHGRFLAMAEPGDGG